MEYGTEVYCCSMYIVYVSHEFAFACSAEFNQLQQQEGETGLKDAN